jgi:hypothetical protein
MNSRKVTCAITGKSFVFNKDYYNKKVEEYGSEENLRKYFIVKKAKMLLARGYAIEEIRNMIEIDKDNILPLSDAKLITVIQFHKLKININERMNNLKFIISDTDPDVLEFINNIKGYCNE